MTKIAIVVVAVAACGRVGFSELPNPSSDGSVDGALRVGPCLGRSLDCDGAVTCRDFESGNFDAWSYECDGDDFECSPTVAEVALEIVDSPPCNGENVYRAFTTGGPGSRQNAYLGQFVDPAVDEDVFVRFAMRWPSGTNIAGTSMVLVPLEPSGSGVSPRFGFGRTVDELRVRLLDQNFFFAAPLVADQWSCLELHLTPNTAEAWVDGEPVLNRTGATIPDGARFETVTLGITASADEGSTEIFFDDFAISPTRIGCP